MTRPAGPSAADDPIPGLAPPVPAMGPAERACRALLNQMQATGDGIPPAKAAHVALALVAFQEIDKKQRLPKASSMISQDIRVALEVLDALAPDNSATDDRLAEAMTLWADEIKRTDAARAADPDAPPGGRP